MGLNEFSDFVAVSLPIRTVSEANCTEHWQKKHKRHQQQKILVYNALKPYREHFRLPVTITLKRYAPRKLDRHDNLPVSFKYITDAICAMITKNYRPGRADDDERITIYYEQEVRKEYGIKIELKFEARD